MVKVMYNLARIAKEKEMSLSQIAEKANVSKGTVWYIAHNRTHPTLYMLAQLAEVLEVPVENLYTIERSIS